jgi:hypothetical protein
LRVARARHDEVEPKVEIYEQLRGRQGEVRQKRRVILEDELFRPEDVMSKE